jgi:hypothetical protein
MSPAGPELTPPRLAGKAFGPGPGPRAWRSLGRRRKTTKGTQLTQVSGSGPQDARRRSSVLRSSRPLRTLRNPGSRTLSKTRRRCNGISGTSERHDPCDGTAHEPERGGSGRATKPCVGASPCPPTH